MVSVEARPGVPCLAVIVTDGYANIDVDHIVYEASVARALGVNMLGK